MSPSLFGSGRRVSSKLGFSSRAMDAFDVEDDEMSGEMSPSVNELIALVGDLEVHGNEESAMQNGISFHPRSLPFVLSFSNLTYSVKVGQRMPFSKCFSRQKVEMESKTSSLSTKTLLDGISGEAREGEIMAVLGASGSGKSTLIDALANRIVKGSLKGLIKLNDEPLESQLLKTISAYVMQDDLLYPMLTVEETMMFSAEFRLPRSLSKSKKRARVQALIDQLGLRDAAKTVIGDEGHRGVSGGERRRVSIGIDIIHDPIILFLDEPTSGLDSTSAFMVVKVLKKIAQAGGMVIMSIHQPSYRIISLLDKMIFLSKGQTVFSGSPATILSYFSELGHPVPENENPTEFALDLILELEGLPNGTTRLAEFNKSWEANNNPVVEHGGNLSLKQAITSRGKLLSGEVNSNSDAKMPTFANPLWTEIITLSRRSTMNSFRSPQPFGTLGAIIVTGTILATLFWKLEDSPRGIQERLGFFAFAMSTTYYSCAHTLPLFVQERYIFMRETAYNTYRRSSYVIARSIVVIPPLTFLALTFSSITFWAVGLGGGGSGFLFYFLVILSAFWAGNSFVTFLSVVVPNIIIGFTIVVAILAYFFLFSGYFITRIRIPDYWIWFHYISLVKYPYEALMQNEFSTPNKCFVRGIQVFDNTALVSVSDSLKTELLKSISATLGMNVTSSTCITKGTDVLLQQGITQLSKWSCLWITVAWGFFYRVLFYFSLMLGCKNKRS